MTVAQLAQAPQNVASKLEAEAKDVCLPHLEKATQPYVVDQSKGPHAGLFSRTAFNAYYMLRHYFGPKRGLYGPESTRGFLKRIERRIERKSQKTGEVPVQQVPRVRAKDLSPEDFQRIYIKSNTPVVIEGLAKEWEAVKTWTPKWFKQNYGQYVMPIRLKADRLDQSALSISDKTVAELVDNIEAGGSYMGGNLEDVFNNNPELREALDLETLTKYEVANKRAKIGSTQLFMSGTGTRSGFHCTNGINLFVQVYGNKEWTFVDPKYTPWMYPLTRKDMFYAASFLDWSKPFDQIAEDGFPLYKYVPKFKSLLQPGDVLFSPQWWWHAVNTPTPTIAVATRTMNSFTLGNKTFSFLWLTSREFRKLFFTLLKTGWGSDADSGARIAFEEEFVDKVTH